MHATTADKRQTNTQHAYAHANAPSQGAGAGAGAALGLGGRLLLLKLCCRGETSTAAAAPLAKNAVNAVRSCLRMDAPLTSQPHDGILCNRRRVLDDLQQQIVDSSIRVPFGRIDRSTVRFPVS